MLILSNALNIIVCFCGFYGQGCQVHGLPCCGLFFIPEVKSERILFSAEVIFKVMLRYLLTLLCEFVCHTLHDV